MRMAAWLLTRGGVDNALIGDLLEQRHAGRSRAWLWRQVVGAIVAAMTRDAAARPLRTAIAVFVALGFRFLTIWAWSSYQTSVDEGVGDALLAVVSLRQPTYVVALSLTNTILLAPVWFLMGFALVHISRAAVPIFVAICLAYGIPSLVRQLQYATSPDAPRWLLAVLLTSFGSSVAAFIVTTLFGAACGLSERHETI